MTETKLLGVRLTAQRYDEAIDRFVSDAAAGRRLRAHFCTVHSLVEATSDPALRAAFGSADMVCMDGLPLVWVSRLKGARLAERVCGPDVMLSVVDRGRKAGLRHYFLGGQPGVAEALAERLVSQFPGAVVAGTQAPPFRPLREDEQREIVESVNAATPDVLWIGLGAPKQELWAAANAPALSVPLLMPVGAAFDFHSGRVRRAPRWMRRGGLEWLFRIVMEPRRLLWRYLSTNTRFVYLLIRDAVSRPFRRSR